MSSAPRRTAVTFPAVIGIDVATASVRAVCVDGRGRVLAEAREGLLPRYAPPREPASRTPAPGGPPCAPHCAAPRPHCPGAAAR